MALLPARAFVTGSLTWHARYYNWRDLKRCGPLMPDFTVPLLLSVWAQVRWQLAWLPRELGIGVYCIGDPLTSLRRNQATCSIQLQTQAATPAVFKWVDVALHSTRHRHSSWIISDVWRSGCMSRLCCYLLCRMQLR